MNTMDMAGLTGPEKRALLARMLKAQGETASRSFPLSHAQQRLWFIDCLQPGTSVYSIPLALRFRGPLDRERLRACLDALVARHESLRTRFVARQGEPVQVVDAPRPVELPVEDLGAGGALLESRLRSDLEAPFDLSRGPLLRCRLFALAPDDHVLSLIVHHIVADYWSLQVLKRELADLYAHQGDPVPDMLPPLQIQYPDYAAWQRQRARDLEGQRAYWRARLQGAPQLLPLPTDFPRPAIQSFNGARHALSLDPALSQGVSRLARARGMTPFMVLLAAFQYLLHRYSGAEDVCVGSTVSNRERQETRDLVGLFVNNLVLRTRFEGEYTFDSLLDQVRRTALEAFSNAEVPFETVVDNLEIERDLGHNALFQVMFVLHNTERTSLSIPGLEVTPQRFEGRTARFDLSLDMYDDADGLRAVFEYNTDLFREETIARLAGHFARLLEVVLADPAARLGRIDLLGPAEHAALAAINATAAPVPESDVAALFEEAAAAHADRDALCCAGKTLSYGDLNAAANRLAQRIGARLGTGQGGARIAICLPRSPDIVVAMLAVLKLGHAYIPLDPAHPGERIGQALEDGGAALMIVRDGETLAGLAERAPCPVLDLADLDPAGLDLSPAGNDNPVRDVKGDDLAYVIFTSGSTGRPKGVPIRQKSLVNLLLSMAREPGMGEADTLVAVTTPAFDIAALELLMPLIVGGRLVMAEAHAVYDDIELMRLLAESRATMMQATPATWRLLSDAGWRAPAGFRVLCGGEALDPALAARLLEGEGTLWNLYGPTETTIWSAATRIRHADTQAAALPIGAPIANTQLHVLDGNLMPVPAGVAGELHIGGIGLSPGYLGRPDLTRATFVANPFHRQGDERHSPRLYRTGDMVRRLEDGRLIYLGRRDFQIKLRGFRIELSEIEAALEAVSGVEQAVVALWPDGEGDGDLVAYCRFGATALEGDPAAWLRTALGQRLPAYMIPSAFVPLERFPLNANGKVDRKRLPQPGRTAQVAAHVPPQGAVEEQVASVWADILGRDRIGRDDNFFHLGGHSLLAARMIARLRQIFPHPPALRTLFEKPSLGAFAATIGDAAGPEAGSEGEIARLPRGGLLPLSYAQQRQWTLAQLDPESPLYNMHAAFRLEGPLDHDRLRRALELTCARQEVLRSRFVARDGTPFVEVAERIDPPLEIFDAPLHAAEERLVAQVQRPFDLARGPLLRVLLVRTGPDEHLLAVVIHHIIADALSMEILIHDLMRGYREQDRGQTGPTPVAAAPAIQYADFAAWQRGQETGGQLDYWRRTLHGAPPLLDLPTDFPRPAEQGVDGDVVRFAVNDRLAKALRDLCGTARATPFMGVLAAFVNLLSRYGDTDDIVIGTPLSQRPHAELEGLVGMFVNTLALRLATDEGDSFEHLLKRTRERAIDAFAHQDVPFEQVVDALEVPRSWSHNPVFQAMFVWHSAEAPPPAPDTDIAMERLALPHHASRVDLTLFVRESGEGFACALEYRRDLFRRETISAMAEVFVTLLERVTARPDTPLRRLSVLPPAQQRRLRAWNASERAYPQDPAGLHLFFAARAGESPQAVAITDGETSLTYGELAARAGRITAALRARGIGRGSRVGIALPRNADLVAALLGVLGSGAAYVPLDPRYPRERIDFITADADLALVLGTARTAHEGGAMGGDRVGEARTVDLAVLLADEMSPADPGERWPGAFSTGTPSDLAYIIYTSGSTGLPKGVAIEHRNAVAFVKWALETFSGEELAGVLASTSVCFDLSIFEIFVTLAAGGRILMVDDLFALPAAPFADEVTLVNTVPTPMAELLRLAPLPESVTTVCLAGEPLSPDLAAKVHASGSVKTLRNLYGPSEDTTYSTGALVPASGAPFGIGTPIANTRAHVLDGEMMEVGIGMPGELYLAGAGIARGYWGRAALTAERFLPDPFAEEGGSAVMYRTGDRVRRRCDGTLDYLGRCDRQIKIRGFRIEPGEVETALERQPGVSAAVVDMWREAGGHGRLAAWVAGDPPPDTTLLAEALRRELPDHLVPSLIAAMPALPRLPNGKLDRGALPDPRDASTSQGAGERDLIGAEEERLAEIWRALLGRDDIGRSDNFFSLGGDSILAIQLVAQARRHGLTIVPRDVFQYPTLAALAQTVGTRTPRPERRRATNGTMPLTPIQHWFFERALVEPAHWNLGVIVRPQHTLDADRLQAALDWLAARHEALRARFSKGEEGWEQRCLPHDAPAVLMCRALEGPGDLTAAAQSLHTRFDLRDGPLWGALLATLENGEQRLVLAAHHLLVDGISWRVILADLEARYVAEDAGSPPPDPPAGGVGDWVDRLAGSPLFDAEITYWDEICRAEVPALPLDRTGGENTVRAGAVHRQEIDPQTTHLLLREVPAAYAADTQDMLVAALALALRAWSGQSLFRLEMESHGRADLFDDVDLSATVGWLTALYPVLLRLDPKADAGAALASVKETLRRVPHEGIGYGVLRHLRGAPLQAPPAPAQIRFNYLGQRDALLPPGSLFAPASESSGPMQGPGNPRDVILEINAMVSGGTLQLHWHYGTGPHRADTIAALAAGFAENLAVVIDHCLSADAAGYTPSDFPHMDLNQADLDDLLRSL